MDKLDKFGYFVTIVMLGMALLLLAVMHIGNKQYERYIQEQKIATESFNEKVLEGYSVILDGREVFGTEKELIANNFDMYIAAYDDSEKEIAVTKKPVNRNMVLK